MKKFNFDKNKKSFILSLLLLAVVVGTAGTVIKWSNQYLPGCG